MPPGTSILAVGTLTRNETRLFQGKEVTNSIKEIVMWAEIVPHTVAPTQRTFHCVGTGEQYPDDWVYIGTVVVNPTNDPVVWHLFEETE